MSQTTIQVREAALTLPSTAPLIRITAGVGSAGQKTWNLRRAVTLIGSRRPAHIVLHDHDVSVAHCVIVNTGTDILLKDLRTRGGTFCNKERVELATLKDGDVVTIGTTQIQVAIQVPADLSDDSGCGLELDDPTSFPSPVSIKLLHTDKRWEFRDAIVVIGRHEEAVIRLEHDDVAPRHAVLFRFGTRPAVFDLGGAAGLWVNGQRCSLTPLDDGDCLTVGPFGLSVHFCDRSSPDAKSLTADSAQEQVPGTCVSNKVAGNTEGPDIAAPTEADDPPDGSFDKPVVNGASNPKEDPVGLDAHPKMLDTSISDLWDSLNSWQSRLAKDASVLSKHKSDLAARAEVLDARDAALRGQLHDITRFNEELNGREQDLARQMAQLQDDNDALTAAQKAFSEKQAELQRLSADIQRRQHAITQRWSRLSSATCPHCGKPTNLGQTNSGQPA